MLQKNEKSQSHCREMKNQMDEDHCSDLLTVVKAMNGYLEAKRDRRAFEYCRENFLMPNTMEMLQDLKSQYAKYLKNLGFISTLDYTHTDYNKNSSNIKLIKCVLVAALCPNIAVGK